MTTGDFDLYSFDESQADEWRNYEATAFKLVPGKGYLYAKKAILVTGIAKDGPLRAFLSDTYKLVKRFSFPDHHRFTWKDINRIQDAASAQPTAAILTTEKDAQRLLDYNGMPESLMQRLFYVPITVDFLSDDEREIFTDFITTV
jgi:tetraacyldisaccharide 4'-kinase